MFEWLVTVGFRVSHREYFLVLLTFLSITFTEDLVLGILIGTAGAIFNFISLYSRIDPIVPAMKTSNVLREFEARKILAALAPNRIISARISGFLFFGSSTLLLQRVREFLHQEPHPVTAVAEVASSGPPRTLLDAVRLFLSLDVLTMRLIGLTLHFFFSYFPQGSSTVFNQPCGRQPGISSLIFLLAYFYCL